MLLITDIIIFVVAQPGEHSHTSRAAFKKSNLVLLDGSFIYVKILITRIYTNYAKEFIP